MSLLTNLTLAYETLADDPIEVGIHYGKSILGLFGAQYTEQTATVNPSVLRRNIEAPAIRRISRAVTVQKTRKAVQDNFTARQSAAVFRRFSSESRYRAHRPMAAATSQQMIGVI